MNAAEFAHAIYELYPPFRPWEDATLKAWTNEVVRKVGGLDPEVFKRAWGSLTSVKHKEKPPQVATIVGHCQEAQRGFNAERNKGKLPLEQPNLVLHGAWTGDRKKLADELIKTPLGKQAAKEGWIGVLWDFCRNQQRLPQKGKEIEDLKKESKAVDAAYALAVRNTSSSNPVLAEMNAKLVAMGDAVMKRRRDLEAIANK